MDVRAIFFDRKLEESMDRLGYAVVPFLDADEVAAISETYWRLGPAPDDPKITTHFDFQSADVGYKETVASTLRPVLEPKVDALLDRYHLFSPNFIMKWPGPRSGFAPHQDTTLVDEDRHRSVTIWCPLTDTTLEGGHDNGVLHFVPGSHDFVRHIRAHDPGAFVFEGSEQMIIDEVGVGIPVRAGEAIVFDHRTIHFSMPNAATDPRLVIALGLRPEEADLLHFRRAGDDAYDVYAIDDDYFIQMSPLALREGPGPYRRVDQVRCPRPSVDTAEFARMCAAVGGADRRRSWLSRLRRPTHRHVNAQPFCFRCGTEEHLVGNPEAGEHGNHHLLCETCAGELAGTATASAR